MRKTFLLMSIVLSFTFMMSCSNDDEVVVPIEVPQEVDTPPIDSLKVKILQPTYVFPYDYTHTGAALIRRMSFRTMAFDATVTTVMLHDGYVPSLSRLDYQNIASLVARGGNVVYCGATRNGVDAFLRNLKAIGLEMFKQDQLHPNEAGYHACRYILNIKEDATGKYLPSFIDNDDTNGVLCDIIAFRGNEKCVVADLEENREVQTHVTDGTDPSTGDTGIEKASDLPLDYMYGLHADKVAEWLDSPSDNDEHERQEAMRLFMVGTNAEETDIDKIAKAQEEQYSFNAYIGWKVAPVTVTYCVWAVHDSKNAADYYLVHQEISLESSRLKCGPQVETGWKKGGEAFADVTIKYPPSVYWAYMTKLGTQVSFSEEDVELLNVSPANNISGQTSYKESMEWSLNTSFVASAKPHASISGGVKISKEWTHNIPDLLLTYQRNKNKPKWEYTAGVMPKAWEAKNRIRHDFAKEILRNDCQVGHSWIWKISNADTTYSFTTDMQVDLQGLWVENGKKLRKGYKTFTNKNKTTITLLPPPRYEQEWLMRMTPTNKTAFESLEKTFQNYWVENFSLYTVEQNDRNAIDNWIKDLQEVIEKNPQSIKNLGLGEFTLTWKLLKETGDYKSYTYKPSK